VNPVVIVAVYRVVAARLLAGVKVPTLPEEVTVPETGVRPGPVIVKVVPVIVAGSIASLKVAVVFPLMATPLAVSAGFVELTVGAVASAVVPVVKVHTLLATKALPARSVTAVVIVAVNRVVAARLLVGVKIAVLSTQVTVPGTAVTVNVVGVQLAGAIDSLKIAVIFRLVATPVAVSRGFVKLTVGAVVSE